MTDLLFYLMIPYYFSSYFMGSSGSVFYALNPIGSIVFSPPIKGTSIYFKDLTDLFERIISGFVYLAAILDIYSRKIVGYAIGKTLSPKLAIAALNMAIATRNTDNLIHHSDQGIQYTCKEYIKILKDNGIRISMSVKGNPYDNAITLIIL